jgi:DNA-binding XRE family transcriptional regulator
VSSKRLREQLELTRSQWARALGVHERTVSRWEDEGADPGGLALEVMHGIELALRAPHVEAKHIGMLLSLGIGSLVYSALIARSVE